jgi:hypothetical protein
MNILLVFFTSFFAFFLCLSPAMGNIPEASQDSLIYLEENFNNDRWWITGWWGDLFEEGVPEPSFATPWANTVSDPDCHGSDCNKVLKISIPQNTHSMSRFFSKDLNITEGWAQYRLWIPKDLGGWDLGEDQIDTNKLPGFNGGGKGNGNKVETNGKNGWSARVGWYVDHNGEFKMSYYTYHMDRSTDHGDIFPWNINIPREKWVTITQHLKVNTLSEFGAEYDGVLEAWVDGVRVFSRSDLRFTSSTDYEYIKNFWLTFYFGGNRTAPEKIKIYLDELEIRGMPKGNSISLSQNYPNPVTRDSQYLTKIKLEVQKAGPVSLQLINALGQVVRRFKDGEYFSVGEHEIEMDLRGLSSGVYILYAGRGGDNKTKDGSERTKGIKILLIN